ncbi:hypothetical protein GCM10009853_043550 [Glycomyces scopariae]
MGPMVMASRPMIHGDMKLRAAQRSRFRIVPRPWRGAGAGRCAGAWAARSGGGPALRRIGRTTATSLSVIGYWDLSEGVGS